MRSRADGGGARAGARRARGVAARHARSRRAAITALAIAATLAAAATKDEAAHANGAFPDSESILTPLHRPSDIILVTNFGLVISADGGGTWAWSCEQPENSFGIFYQVAPAPRRRLYAVANGALAYSDDGSCGWRTGAGAVAGLAVTDAFVDPARADRVLVVGRAGPSHSVHESTDGGATFGPPLHVGAPGETIDGVEAATGDPRTIYLAVTSSDTSPLLVRSNDGGASWTPFNLRPHVGPGLLRIIAVDPEDPRRVLLRLLGSSDESLVLTTDGGVSATRPLVIDGSFTAFVRLPATGTLLAAANVESATVPALFRSRDGGASFDRLPTSLAIRGLSQRGDIVYAATDNFGAGYAIGGSSDEGETWQPVMSYAQVQAILPCVKSRCQATCRLEADLSLWSEAVCSADAPGTGGGGGGLAGDDGGAGGPADGGAGGAGGHGADAADRPPSRRGGGGCRISPGDGAARLLDGSLLWTLLLARRFAHRVPGRGARANRR